MKNEHTPGPWKWHIEDDWWKSEYEGRMPYLESIHGFMVCSYGIRSDGITDEGDPPNRFDRPLIAAAPDMLEALQNLENDDGSTMPATAWELVQKAIAKATGK